MKKSTILFLFLIIGTQLFGQVSSHFKILVNANNTVPPPYTGNYHTYHDIVPELAGVGVQLFNIRMNDFAIPMIGNPVGPITYGKFAWDSLSDIGIDSGMVMGSGWVPPTNNNFNFHPIPGMYSGIPFPAFYNAGANNDSGYCITAFQFGDGRRWSQSLDLVDMNYGDSIADANILEFDFVPDSNHIALQYVFASEEYPNMDDPSYPSTVCDTPNDVMAIFLSGPGISGEQNIALIPGTDIPVGVNTITPSGWNCNGLPDYSQYYVDNTGGQNVIYNGFTTLLTAKAQVIPADTYHLRIAVADGARHPEITGTLPANYSDPLLGFYDSGIFLKFGSFHSYHAEEDTTNGIISRNAGIQEIKVIPNPFSESFRLYSNETTNPIYSFQLFDMMGRRILQLQGNIGTLNQSLNHSNLLMKLPSGFYVLQLFNKSTGVEQRRKLIKEE